MASDDAKLAMIGFQEMGATETLTYRPVAGGTRTIQALVRRFSPENLPGSPAPVRSHRIEITVLNDSTYGISDTEAPDGGIDIRLTPAATAATHVLGKAIEQNGDWLKLTVN